MAKRSLPHIPIRPQPLLKAKASGLLRKQHNTFTSTTLPWAYSTLLSVSKNAPDYRLNGSSTKPALALIKACGAKPQQRRSKSLSLNERNA
jgi:hypothetical protein